MVQPHHHHHRRRSYHQDDWEDFDTRRRSRHEDEARERQRQRQLMNDYIAEIVLLKRRLREREAEVRTLSAELREVRRANGALMERYHYWRTKCERLMEAVRDEREERRRRW
nr:hypothetical protein B0A51_01657 [Rachicladosporium sp. CCFEE 5018]OQO31514.1 hypothetical protein B0A51_01281 [Rachicladosporium sp. CCFEE 5018]